MTYPLSRRPYYWSGNLLRMASGLYVGGLFRSQGEVEWHWVSDGAVDGLFADFSEAQRIVEVTGRLEGWL